MNEELIRQCAVLAARAWPNATRQFVAEVAIREALDRHVAPLVEAVRTYLKVADRIEGATDALEQALAPFQQEGK